MANPQFRAKIKIIRSDNGYEFIFGPMKKFYRDQGLSIKQVVLTPPNKRVGLKENIATF